MNCEVIVVGAGAAGLMAACRSAERGRATLLLEKNDRPGIKILMSGGTRCNVTHHTNARGIIAAFGSQGRALHTALARLSPADLVEWLHAEGVSTKVESTGKVFPVSDKAADVLGALLRRLKRSGCELSLSEPVTQIERLPEGGFEVATTHRTLRTEKLVITTGGRSYPKSGTTGDGYSWCAALGHTLEPLHPALTPLTTNAPWVANLQGVTLPDVRVHVIDPAGGGSPLAERRGSLLFAHFGVTGPAVLDVSRAVTGHAAPATLELECDFLPDVTAEQLERQFAEQAAAQGKRGVAGIFPGSLPARLVETLLELAQVPAQRRAAEMSRVERARLVHAAKRCRIPLSGARGYAKAEVTAGGVRLSEVDFRTMQSKLVPGLFLAGEILDLDGWIGGYNFQAAFSTGFLAGENV